MKKCAKANNFLNSCGGHAEKENGLHDLIEIMLESMMVAERGEYLRGIDDGNKGNGYRLGHTYGYGRRLEGNAYAWRYAK